MEAIADTVIPREDNPATATYFTKPLFITGVLGEMTIMQLDRCPSLSEGISHNALPETTIKEKDERGYAA